MNKEMIMRREELDYEAQLRREEMSQREKESEAFASVFTNLAAALLQRKWMAAAFLFALKSSFLLIFLLLLSWLVKANLLIYYLNFLLLFF